MKKILLILCLITFLALGLRIFQAGQFPTLYWDEVSLGYDAYSLAETGHDHRGMTPKLAYLFSYRDYKPPLYVYLLTPVVKLAGLSQLTTRLPSILAGSLMPLALYALVVTWWPKSKKLGLLAAFLVAVSPWSIHFSRLAFEVNLATVVSLLSVLVWSRYRQRWWGSLLFVVLLASTTYIYHGFRVTAPLILLTLVLYQLLIERKLKSLLYILLFAFLTLPIYSQLAQPEIYQRTQETSLFTTLDPILESNALKLEDNYSFSSRLLHHRYVEYTRLLTANYLKNFNLSFLFLGDDINPRHGFTDRGLMYVFEIVLFLLGLALVWWQDKRHAFLLTALLLIAFIPAGLTKSSPHALRILPANPWLILIISLGLWWVVRKYSQLALLIPLVYFLALFSYLHHYYAHYLPSTASSFQFGYQPAIEFVIDNAADSDTVYLSDHYGRAYMYYLFHSEQTPQTTQLQMRDYILQPQPAKLDNWLFDRRSVDISLADWFIVPPNENLPVKTTTLHTIYYPNSEDIAFVIKKKL